MIAILKKSEHNIDFHQIVDFIEASHIRYALTINPTVYVTYIRQFWSTARIKTTNEGTKILITIDGKPRTISESSIMRNLKLNDEEGISSLPDTELFENLELMGYNILPNQRYTFQKEIPTLRQYSRRATRIAQPKALSPTADEPASLLRDDCQGEAFPTVSRLDFEGKVKILEDKDRGSAEPSGDDSPIKGRSLEIREEVGVKRSTKLGRNNTEEMVIVSTVGVPTISGLVPTVSAIFSTASVLARDAEIARLHAEEELKMMIEGLDRSNEMIENHLQEYEQFEAELTIGEKIELINELVKYQDHHAKILKYQAQQSKPLSKKEQREFYMLGGNTTVYQFFVDMLKQFDREYLHQLWALLKETLIIRHASRDKEMELWVELKRLFEPDFEDQLWTHTQNLMHDPLDWKLYDTCGVYHVFTKDQEIFMLVERDYPLRRGLAIVMISNKLQVENYS
nr:hypothetical protein [Tanacetum cinerariifolium]